MAEYEIEFRCKHCGKPITVLHPSQWGYKVRNKKGGWTYYCTWKCLRADEKENEKPEQAEEQEEKDGRNNRLEVLEELMEAVKGGKDAYDFLEQLGYTDPKDTLRRLRITAKKEAPKLYTKMEKAGLLDLRKGHSGKGVDRMSQNKLTREQKEKAVQIALNGGDYLEHLKKCGAKNPSAAWWYIRKTLGKSNPELLEEINKKTGEGAEVEVAEKLPEEATITGEEKEQLDELTRDGMPLDEEMEEVKERLKGARVKLGEKHKTIGDAFEELAQGLQTRLNPTRKPVNYDGFEIMCIKGEFGEYRTDGQKFNFANAPKIMYFEMNKEDLAAFLDEIRRAAQILGVDAG